MIVNRKYKFIFIHVPKNAGTSLSSTLSKLRGNDPTVVSRETRHETYKEFRDRVENVGVLEKIDFSSYLSIAVIRNPIKRFVSLHRFLIDEARNKYPLVPTNINDFVGSVESKEDWTNSIRSLRPQCQFIEGVGGPLFVGRFEEIQDSVLKVGKLLSIRMRIKHLNATKRRPTDSQIELTRNSIDFLACKYADDFDTFGYTFTYDSVSLHD